MKTLLIIIGVVYVWVGVVSTATALYFLMYGPSLFEGLSFIFVVLPLFNAAASLAIAYGFFRERWWGRYLALIFNGVYFVVCLGGFVISQVTERPQVPVPAMITLIAILALLGGIMLLCLQPSVRRAMTR